MFDGRDLHDAERWIDEWRCAIDERAERARAFAARLARLSETARSPDGLVTVTIGPGGELTELGLAEDIRRRPAADTAREILATLRAARSRLATAVAAAADETVGADSATGRAVIDAYTVRGSRTD